MATKNQNDKVILDLKKKIEEKKKLIDRSEKFSPKTNCSIEIDGIRKNIQVLNKDELTLLLIKLNAYRMSAKDLGIDDFEISSYSIHEWISDTQSRLANLNRKQEEQRLKAMEQKLHNLLSNEKKIEIEIEEIASLL